MDLKIIEEKADGIVKKYNPEGLSPFPYEKIEADRNDLKIFVLDLPVEISGAINFDNPSKQFNIFINKNKPKTRQHFTIAHELGHYFLHQSTIKTEEVIVDGESSLEGNKTLFRLDQYASNAIETEANNFAANLIMPKDLVTRAWSELKSVEECAKIFNVSVSAMSIRLEKLCLI